MWEAVKRMDISFYCGSCGQNIVIDEAGAGLATNCPKCGQPLIVPRQGAPQPEAVTFSPTRAAGNLSVSSGPSMPPWAAMLLVVILLMALAYAYLERRETVTARSQNEAALSAAKARMTQLESNLQTMASQAQEEKAKAKARELALVAASATVSSLSNELVTAKTQIAQLESELQVVASQAKASLAVEATREAEKKTVAPFFAAAEGALAAMRNINSAINAGIQYNAYSDRVLELAAKADELERVAKETGLLSKDPDAGKLCSIMLLIAEDHNLARTYWKATFATVEDEPDYWAAQRFGITEYEALGLKIKADKAVLDKQQRGRQNMREMWDKVPADSEKAEGILKALKKRYGLQ